MRFSLAPFSSRWRSVQHEPPVPSASASGEMAIRQVLRPMQRPWGDYLQLDVVSSTHIGDPRLSGHACPSSEEGNASSEDG